MQEHIKVQIGIHTQPVFNIQPKLCGKQQFSTNAKAEHTNANTNTNREANTNTERK